MKGRVGQTEKRSAPGGTNFLVSIYHQENHSWQGVIQWLDTGQKVHFRSELEMLLLMQEAAGTTSDEQRSWVKNSEKKTG